MSGPFDFAQGRPEQKSRDGVEPLTISIVAHPFDKLKVVSIVEPLDPGRRRPFKSHLKKVNADSATDALTAPVVRLTYLLHCLDRWSDERSLTMKTLR